MDYKDLTIKQYYDILEVLKEEDPVEVQVGLVDAVYGVDSTKIPIQEFKKKIDSLSFLNKPYKAKKMKSSYVVDGMKFNTITDFSNITTAQFIDFQSLLKMKQWKYLLNCLFVKDGEDYGDNDYSTLLYEKLSLSAYFDTLESFSKLFKALQTNILKSDLKTMKKELKSKEKRMPVLKRMIEMKQMIHTLDSV